MYKFFSHLFLVFMLFSFSSADVSGSSFLDNPSNSLNDLMSEEPQFLPVDEAFEFSFEQQGEVLKLTWKIAPEYYLYRDKTKFAPIGVSLGEVDYPAAETIEDEYFGTSAIYRDSVTLTVPLKNIQDNAELKIKYQGCAEAGLCYPPTKKQFPLIVPKAKNDDTPTTVAMVSGSNTGAGPGEPVQVSQQNQLAETLASGSFLVTLLMFFGLGVGLAFTPCVFPMYPILSGIIAGRCDKMTTKYGLTLSFVYVQGMALTYSLLGLVVASAGMKFQAYFQNPYVLIGMSLLFVLLALSMFGWFELKLPASWNEKLTNISNQQKGGSFGGVFVMGALSGLIASPCTTAPLTGVLLYVAQSGDLFIGGLTLYILSLGMGLPLLILGASGGKLLPKAGTWMDSVKTVFGFLLLGVPLILLDRMIDFDYTLTAGAILTIALCAYLYTMANELKSAKAKTAVSFVSIGFFVASLMTLQQVWWNNDTTSHEPMQMAQQADVDSHGFINIESLDDLKAQLEIAKAQNKPLMIDLYADWCVACKEFEAYTFTDAAVKEQMAKFMLVRADVTQNNDIDIELLENYDILGLPSLLFFNTDSKELTGQRITGFMDAEAFNQHLQQVLTL